MNIRDIARLMYYESVIACFSMVAVFVIHLTRSEYKKCALDLLFVALFYSLHRLWVTRDFGDKK